MNVTLKDLADAFFQRATKLDMEARDVLDEKGRDPWGERRSLANKLIARADLMRDLALVFKSLQ